MDKLKPILIGAFLSCTMCGKAQLHYTHDSSGNLISVTGNSWSTLNALVNDSTACVADSTSLKIAYDPSVSKAYISIIGDKDVPCYIFLYDIISNQLIDQKKFQASSFEYDLSPLARGVYAIEAIRLQEKKSLKISKQ